MGSIKVQDKESFDKWIFFTNSKSSHYSEGKIDSEYEWKGPGTYLLIPKWFTDHDNDIINTINIEKSDD